MSITADTCALCSCARRAAENIFSQDFFKRCLRRRGKRSAACSVCAHNAHFCAPYTPNGHSKTPLDGSILQPFENVAGGLGLVGVIILLAFLFGVVWGVIGTALSAAVPNRYVALCGPFVLFFLMHLVASALQKKSSARPILSCPIFCRRSDFCFVSGGALGARLRGVHFLRARRLLQ